MAAAIIFAKTLWVHFAVYAEVDSCLTQKTRHDVSISMSVLRTLIHVSRDASIPSGHIIVVVIKDIRYVLKIFQHSYSVTLETK